jgi:ABC-type multidrug transport system ATPase subunit
MSWCSAETSTVREYLLFHAQLRMGDMVPPEECAERVDDVIALLNLHSCADSRIGGGLQRGISGGENRRARIAAELLTYPRLLLVDEVCLPSMSTACCWLPLDIPASWADIPACC